MAKNNTKRSRAKYPNLKPELNLKTRFELLDMDYIDKLNDSEKEWLNKVMGEYVGASFDKDNRKNIQKSKEHKKDSYDRNNARNRCILTRAKATGIVDYIEEMKPEKFLTEVEDDLIYNIDSTNFLKELTDSEDSGSDD
jgi:hypothetical protein